MRQIEEKSPANPPCQCVCHALTCQAVEEAVNRALKLVAAEEADQWRRCFGDEAPGNPKTKLKRVVRTASARAALSIIGSSAPALRDGDGKSKYPLPNSSACCAASDTTPDFSDFFPEKREREP